MRYIVRRAVTLTIAIGALSACSVPAGPAQPTPSAAPSAAAVASSAAAPIAANTLVVAEGVVQPLTSLPLRFPFTGMVAEVLVEEGQQVRSGDVLARLDTRQLQLDLERAALALEQSQLSLEELKAGPLPEEVQLYQARLANAQADLRSALAVINSADLNAAEESLTASQQDLAQLNAGPRTSDVEIARATLAENQANLERTRDGLSATKTTLELRLHQLANDIRIAQDDYSRIYWRNKNTSAEDLTQQRIDEEAEARRKIENLELELQKARVEFDEAVQNEVQGTQAAEADVRAAQARLDAVLAGPDPGDVTATRAIVERNSASIQRLNGDYRAAGVDAARARLAEAEAAMAVLQSQTTETDIAQAELAVRIAQLELKQVRTDAEDAALRAPVDGTVVIVTMRPGDSSEGARIELADVSQWRVETRDLSEIDVVRIREGGKAVITFVALPDLRLTGKVVKLRLVEKPGGDPPAYRATIALDTTDDRLYWNLSASVAILSE